MTHSVEFLIRYGYVLIFGWVFAEQIGIPVPAIPVLLAAGALAGTHRINPVGVLALAITAAISADVIWYELGRRKGIRVLQFLCKISLEPDSCVRRTENVFARNGAKSLLIAKFVPGLNTAAQPLAGIFRMKFSRFLLFDALGATLYVGTFFGLGYIFKTELERVAGAALQLGVSLVTLVVATLLSYLGYKYYRRQKFIRQLRIDRITPEELKTKLDAGEEVVIVDLRGSLDFEAEPAMIPGAVHLDYADLEEVSDELAKAAEVVLYCNCPNEVTSAKMALMLRRKGVQKIRPLQNGLNGWRDLGYPVKEAAEELAEASPPAKSAQD
jgi:membrane protein DedA with SNARE-associated domain/rhodanese-related sulfurtransferase